MARWKSQAWVTVALSDDHVAEALVLANSIRKTRSTRKLVVIISTKVSTKNRVKLLSHFDQYFLLDSNDDKNVEAKIFAYSLILFEKCVFLSGACLFLENADALFETKNNFQCCINQDGSKDLSLFVFTPNKTFFIQLWQKTKKLDAELSDNMLSAFLQNQEPFTQDPGFENHIAKFEVPTGKLSSQNLSASIIHFVGNEKFSKDSLEQMTKVNFGLHEKTIVDMWLQGFHEVFGNSTDIFQTKDLNAYSNEPIAIVGMSCRYPGANTLEEFWNMLYAGEEGIREPPAFRWTKEQTLRVGQQDRKSAAGFLATTVDEFDARFFGVSPKEATYMDPQTRLLHEVLWESLEDAGIEPLSLYGSHTGIFTGSWMNDYKDIVAGSAEKDFFRTYMGNSIGAAAARLSFLLGLTGPSIATESGCSSAIVALDLAVRSLRAGETNLALAGGVNLLLHPFNSDIMEYVIAPNGRCKTFDAKADGFGRAEGCGVLVLKRLSDAIRDRDHIWALVRGSAVSQEGLSRSLGTPTVHCEALAMQLALEDANVKPERVSFVETHGTGTQVGDPMEASAIAKAYYSPRRKEPLIIGSVKTNVGHTESCSGITGIMKAVLALQHEIIPKHRNMDTVNPEIFLDSIPAIIPMENLPWPKKEGNPRLCGVSSFGITGTDGHVILEETPSYQMPKFSLGLERSMHLLTISAKSCEALAELLNEYENRFADEQSNEWFANAAYSANVGRASFSHRAVIVASNSQDAVKMLKEKKFLQGEAKDCQHQQICFLFTGQGSQYQGMAKMLFETSPVFRINFDACDRTLREQYGLSIRQVLWESNKNSKALSRTIYSQISIFCVEYCLLKLWQSWGIYPDYVLGHSLGEFCAAVAAGVLGGKESLD